MKKPKQAAEPIRSEKRFWTVKDAARYLGLSEFTLYDWINVKKERPKPSTIASIPPVYRFGSRRAIRFKIDEFIEWAETFKQGQA
jgi:predicted DNA-binding transcriptional regulator AlpA